MMYNSGTNESAGAQFVPAPGVALSPKEAKMRAKSIPTFTPAQEERFWSHVEVYQPAGCWEWTGNIGDHGYGRFPLGGTLYLAHRVALTLLIGPPPVDLHTDHLCRNRKCVNPDHLQSVTHRENMLRGFGAAGLKARQTHCKRGHEFTPENTKIDPRRPTSRICKICSGAINPSKKLTDADVRVIRDRVNSGEMKVTVARDFGVDPSTVSKIVHGIARTSVK